VRDRLHLIEADLFTIDGLRIRPELCIHLAWYVEPSRYLTAPVNLDYLAATLKLARWLAANGCRRMVGVGTCFEYAESQEALREDSPTRPGSLYAASKLAAANVLQQFCPTASMEFAWPRLFYQYGPMEDPRRLVPTIINGVLRQQRVELTTGEQVRDFLYVADVASALVHVAESSMTGIVNIGSGQPTTVRNIAETIGEILGGTQYLGFGLRPMSAGEPMCIVADNSRLWDQTGWRPEFDLVAGLRQTVEWWKNNR